MLLTRSKLKKARQKWYYDTATVEALTDSQITFVSHLVLSGVTPTEAARRAGYSHPKNRAWELLRKPHIVAAIRKEQERFIDGDLANVALKTLRSIMENEKSPANARVAASRAVLEAAGYFSRNKEAELEEKQIMEMTAQELEEYISRGRENLKMLSKTAGNA